MSSFNRRFLLGLLAFAVWKCGLLRKPGGIVGGVKKLLNKKAEVKA